MPGRDGTGPKGMGPGTGRGAGDCTETGVPQNSSTGLRLGLRSRRRMGRGRRVRGGRSRFGDSDDEQRLQGEVSEETAYRKGTRGYIPTIEKSSDEV